MQFEGWLQRSFQSPPTPIRAPIPGLIFFKVYSKGWATLYDFNGSASMLHRNNAIQHRRLLLNPWLIAVGSWPVVGQKTWEKLMIGGVALGRNPPSPPFCNEECHKMTHTSQSDSTQIFVKKTQNTTTQHLRVLCFRNWHTELNLKQNCECHCHDARGFQC